MTPAVAACCSFDMLHLNDVTQSLFSTRPNSRIHISTKRSQHLRYDPACSGLVLVLSAGPLKRLMWLLVCCFNALLHKIMQTHIAVILCISVLLSRAAGDDARLSDERVVFQTNWGDVEFGFYPEVRLVHMILYSNFN